MNLDPHDKHLRKVDVQREAAGKDTLAPVVGDALPEDTLELECTSTWHKKAQMSKCQRCYKEALLSASTNRQM